MSRELDELLGHLRSADLKHAAFEIISKLSGGVYPKDMQDALQLFSTLPCPETGVLLIAACPEVADIFALSNYRLSFSKEMERSNSDKYEKWMESFARNEKASKMIRLFLLEGAKNGTISIGFHRLRNQQVLIDRLSILEVRKGFFKNRRQFLREKITKNALAFNCVIDKICVHGIAGGRECFWNALGAECGPQLHLQSEIQYNLSTNADNFLKLLREI